ncbi:accessory factor UbiK family protein [Caldichromatium japonicum]|uniref:Ubiquinone biosynthesis accessory factor UbiK n=1 Tax=Caldichromatium japonicum TaxID=2699430 RepID=A0A6G7VBI8_9GAMM|nr:accessory factor UbiK family protein [Caldichromatium japonicum]QIK37236.1 accessory factor UbiK family protein [Caldichromatium japonicum]
MLAPKHFEDLIQRLSATLPRGIQVMQDDLDRNLRAGLEAALARLDLVTREEFEVQAAVLARTRAKLKALEKRVAKLEQALAGHGAHVD